MKNYILIIASLLLGSTVFGQTTWYEIQTGVNAKLNAVDFPTSNVGYIVGLDTTILKTTDGGQTWMQLGLNGIGIAALADNFTDVHFLDENTGYLVSGYSGVWRTTDGAQSWTQVGTAMCFPYSIFPTSATDYIVGGGDCFMGARIDVVNGSTVAPATITTDFWNDQQKVLEMSFSDPLTGLAAVRNEYILRTVDGGNNWDTISTGIPGVHTSVVMVNDTLCYAGYEDFSSQGFGILKSEDGGLTWEMDINSATFYYPSYMSVVAANNGDIYSGGFSSISPGGLIFESLDGVSWDYQNVNQPINAMTSVGSDITFGVGDSGYLVVNMPVAELGIDESEVLEFTVYPNPASEELIIENPNNQAMEIRILDARGSVVRTKNAQNGPAVIDFTELNQGIYFVELKIGEEMGVKRIVKK